MDAPPNILPRLNRRTFMRSASVAGLSSLLAGCGVQAAGGVERLAFWHLLSGGDGIRLNDIFDQVRGQVPGTDIKQTVLAWGAPYYTKLAMASAGGRAPDLAVMHLSRLAGYAPGGLLDPWDLDRFARYGLSRASFTAPTFERMTVEGSLFGIALDSHAFVRFFNPDVAAAAGQLGTDGRLLPTTSVEAFIDQAQALGGQTGGLGISYGWLGDSSNMWRLFWTFYTQQGAQMVVEDDHLAIDEDAFLTALQTIVAIISSGAANRRSDGGFAFSSFTAGQSGEFFSGVWDLPGILDSGVPLDASPIPNLFGTDVDAVWGDSHSFVLPHQDSPDEARRERVYEVVSYILKDSITWAEAGHTPAFQPVVAQPAFSALLPNAHYAETANFLQYDPVAPFAGSGSNWQNQFGQAVQAALLGDESVEQALAEFTRVSDRFVRTSRT